jgi:hypothetical protein
MDETRLRERLAALHEELGPGVEVDEETRRLLQAIMEDIRRTLESPGEVTLSEHESLVERLRGAGQDLEDSHPRLTTAVSQVVDALTRLFS